MTIALSTTVRNAQMDAITTAAGASAKLIIYNGTRPASGGAGTTALATLTCASTLGAASSGGVLTLNAVTSAAASATGTATWARITTSSGTWVADMDVGTDVTLNTTSIVSGATVSVTSGTLTAGNP